MVRIETKRFQNSKLGNHIRKETINGVQYYNVRRAQPLRMRDCKETLTYLQYYHQSCNKLQRRPLLTNQFLSLTKTYT